MILQPPLESQYDIRFRLLGFSTRISWTFWLVAIVLGYDLAQYIDSGFPDSSPGSFALLLIWIGCMAVSILIHELGHAVAFRRYGIDSSIVLYYLGGLAIPGASFRGSRSFRSVGSREELVIAAAGPAFQIGSALLVVLIAWFADYRVSLLLELIPKRFESVREFLGGRQFEDATTFALVNFYVWPSVLWGLLNLVPVLPLDGGRIAKAIIEMQGGATVNAMWLSVITAALLAWYGFDSGQMFLGIFFASLAINNYQAIQPGSPW
jgi:stage IV sporulation protein FB